MQPANPRPVRSIASTALLLFLVTAPLMSNPTSGTTGASDTYVAGATAVVASGSGNNTTAIVDSGGVVCNKRSGVASLGGGCIPFGWGDSISVSDSAGPVAFQVCIDNSGDGVCTFEPGAGGCADDLYFSHAGTTFYSTLGPLPTGFRAGCAGGPWQGYVVLLCEGVHDDSGNVHAHAATRGTIVATTGGSGFGDFCGSPEPQGKVYVVV